MHMKYISPAGEAHLILGVQVLFFGVCVFFSWFFGQSFWHGVSVSLIFISSTPEVRLIQCDSESQVFTLNDTAA